MYKRQYVLNKGKETGIHVLSCACVTKGMQGKELVDMDALRAAGAAGFTDEDVYKRQLHGRPTLFMKAATVSRISALSVSWPIFTTFLWINWY